MRRSVPNLVCIAFLTGILTSSLALARGIPSGKTSDESNSTLANLQTAYADERTAEAAYTVSATKADEEGFHQVASMFRAIARAEAVHAESFAKLIRAAGATPQEITETPVPKSTRENLEAAVTDEDHFKDIIYPKYITQAKRDRNREAELAFTHCKLTNAEHAAFYDQVLGDLDAYRGGNQNFYVCPVCGNTTVAMHSLVCPICKTPKDKFVAIR